MKPDYYYIAKKAGTLFLKHESDSPNLPIINRILSKWKFGVFSCPATDLETPKEEIKNYGLKSWNYSNFAWHMTKSGIKNFNKLKNWFLNHLKIIKQSTLVN